MKVREAPDLNPATESPLTVTVEDVESVRNGEHFLQLLGIRDMNTR